MESKHPTKCICEYVGMYGCLNAPVGSNKACRRGMTAGKAHHLCNLHMRMGMRDLVTCNTTIPSRYAHLLRCSCSSQVYTTSVDGTVRLWELASGACLRTIDAKAPIKALAVHKDLGVAYLSVQLREGGGRVRACPACCFGQRGAAHPTQPPHPAMPCHAALYPA